MPRGMNSDMLEIKRKFDTSRKMILPILLFVLAIICASSMLNESPTIDEGRHFSYGIRVLNGTTDRFDDSKMPVTALNAVVWKAGEILGKSGLNTSFLSHYNFARLSTILAAVLLGFYVYRLTQELYGNDAASLSLFLFAFSPNIIAHSKLVTNDLYEAAAIFISVYYFRKFLHKPDCLGCLKSSFCLGISQAVKYFCVLLFPLFMILAFLRYWREIVKGEIGRKALAKSATFVGIFLIIVFLIVNMAFLFNNSFMTLSDYSFKSSFLSGIKEHSGILGNIRIPLPYPYVEGLDWVKYHEKAGKTFGRIYMLGEFAKRGEGFHAYYLVAYLFKETIPAQIFFLSALIIYLRRRNQLRFFEDELFLLVPAAFLAIYLSFFLDAQLGIRYFLPVLPFLYVFSGSLLKNGWNKTKPLLKILISFLALWQVISIASYYPYFIPYFNEFVPDRKMAYQILADSNIDWGQSDKYLAEYCQKNPDIIFQPRKPVPGKIIVGVNSLVGVNNPESFRWLRDNFHPSSHIAYSFLIYEVSAEDLRKLKLTEIPVPNGGK